MTDITEDQEKEVRRIMSCTSSNAAQTSTSASHPITITRREES